MGFQGLHIKDLNTIIAFLLDMPPEAFEKLGVFPGGRDGQYMQDDTYGN
jgi:hypothetical protein